MVLRPFNSVNSFRVRERYMPLIVRGLTAQESVGRRRAQLRGSGIDVALGPRPVHRALAFWMQTTCATLLATKRRSLVRVLMIVHDGRCAHGLLYLAAVRDDRRELEHRQGHVDVGLLHSRLRRQSADCLTAWVNRSLYWPLVLTWSADSQSSACPNRSLFCCF